jgi:hypothetical protein
MNNMRKLITILVTIIFTSNVFSQAPEKMSYQAVIRYANDKLVTNQGIGMQISILKVSASGTAVYIETQATTTNANGLVSIEIGNGTVISGDFSTIDWANDTYFIKTETDLAGGSNYTITGTSQLLSVPYALHAKTAESITLGTTLAIGNIYQGGIIFYLDASGQHGLIVATTNQSIGEPWINGSLSITNAVRDGIGAGIFNTERIIANQSAPGAAQLCANFQGGGYGDWYLPSKYELNLLYLQKAAVGGFDDAYYRSSTEYDYDNAWIQFFSNGSQEYANKDFGFYVRAIRAF